MNTINYDVYVFTTKRLILEGDPILRVLHDEDGDWQFLGKEDVLNESDAMVFSLGEILELDPSILDVISIPNGTQALRDKIGGEWLYFTPTLRKTLCPTK